jgi:hypothetical protein
MSSSKFVRRLRSLILVATSATGIAFGYSYYKNDENFFRNIIMPTVRLLDAEKAHELAVLVCKWKVLPAVTFADPGTLVSSFLVKIC